MKKILVFILCLLMVLSFVSCGKKGETLYTYQFDEMSVRLPEGEANQTAGYEMVYTNEKFTMKAVADDKAYFELAGLDFDKMTIQEYADLLSSQLTREAYEKDDIKKVSLIYSGPEEGKFSYEFVEKSAYAFWIITFTGSESEKDELLPLFKNYGKSVKFS